MNHLPVDHCSMRTCQICSREFSKPYNLRVHYKRVHPQEPIPVLERIPRSEVMDQVTESEDDSNEEVSEYEDNESNHTDDIDVDGDGGMEVSDDDDDIDAADEDTEHRVFDWIIQEAADELGEGAIYEDLQNRFRRKFADILGWHYRLRKHPVYKKVMATARDLHDSDGDYDWPEAYETAVEQRKFLLNRLVPQAQESADEDNV